MATRDPNNKTRFLIIGAGIAGMTAAATLREQGFTGEILVISREDIGTYDRSLLSKCLIQDQASNWLLQHDHIEVDLKLKSRVWSVNPKLKKVILTSGEHIQWDKLLIATGCEAVKPQIPGVVTIHPQRPELASNNVYFLRNSLN